MRETLFRSARFGIAGLVVMSLAGCETPVGDGPADAPSGPSRAFAAWTPGPFDSCTPQIHDQYATVGPDNKLYPTWHPPVDPGTGCMFGHEHGRDPSGSDLFGAVGAIPFGYGNEVADLFAPHVGFKVEWENDVEMSVGRGDLGRSLFRVSCDVLVELHQGSAGAGAFINPLHELAYHARCSDGTELHFTKVSTIGDAGGFQRSCDSDVRIEVSPGQPAGAPDGGGKRRIPDRQCVLQHILVADGARSSFGSGLRESWQLSESLRSADGHRLASVGPYFNVHNPSRYYDPNSPTLISRPIDLCFEQLPDGRRAQGGLCEDVVDSIPWDQPGTPFDGAHRDVDINSIRIDNSDGPEIWYTDAFGRNGSKEAFPGSIRQFIARVNNEALTPNGPSVGRDRRYGEGQGVHPPN